MAARTRIIRLALIALLFLVLLTAAAVVTLRASLPQLDGERTLAGLDHPVTVRRDDLGVVTLRGSARSDLAQATGFVHAQDRFFQMDLARRQAAGELAALFGAAAVPVDRRNRLHRFRHRAEASLASGGDADRVLLAAYARGVNQGLEALGARPFEYLVLKAQPEPWRPEDSLLVAYSMFLTLNDARGERDAALGLMYDLLPAELVDFMVPGGTPWDAPVQGDARPAPQIPGPEVIDLRRAVPGETIGAVSRPVRMAPLPGSNNWAVAGSASATGAAMVANDMHLPLRVPNTFYRLRLELEAGGPGSAVTGVTIPGIPVMIAGSNGHVAWGFTNSYGDWTDLALVATDPDDPGRYLVDGGSEPIRCSEEMISIRGGEAVAESVCETRWGPLMGPDHRGRQRALRWLAHEPGAVNMELLRMERAGTVAEAMDVANRAGNPPQNMVVADRDGAIGWTIMGRIPRRRGYDPARPADLSRPDTGWSGWLQPVEYPRIVDPPGGRIWTANARVVDGEALMLLGDGGYALGARAGQIRDRLVSRPLLEMDDMLAIQLDDRAVFYRRWRDLLLEVLDQEAITGEPGREEFRRILVDWVPRADPEAVGFRLVYETRARLLRQLFESLSAEVRRADPDFGFEEGLRYGLGRQFEGPAWQLLTRQPTHLLDPGFESWQALILAAVDATRESAARAGRLSERTWGERNQARIRHPLSAALWPVARWLDMPAQPLAGATQMPRVQSPDFGASERFAVSPGRESEAYLHMPAGQSGHPLSPYYRAGHDAWVEGRPTAFLPGPAQHRLVLSPMP